MSEKYYNGRPAARRKPSAQKPEPPRKVKKNPRSAMFTRLMLIAIAVLAVIVAALFARIIFTDPNGRDYYIPVQAGFDLTAGQE